MDPKQWLSSGSHSTNFPSSSDSIFAESNDKANGSGFWIWYCFLEAADSSLIPDMTDSTNGDSEIPIFRFQQDSAATPLDVLKHQHYGNELSWFAFSHNSYGLEFHAATAFKTPTDGCKKVFAIQSSNLLIGRSVKEQFKLDFDGPVTFIELSQIYKFSQRGHGSMGVFCVHTVCSLWNLGMLSGIFPMNFPPLLDVFEWSGPVVSVNVQNFVDQKAINDWSRESDHILLCEFHPKDIELNFVNQISEAFPLETVLFSQQQEIKKTEGFNVHHPDLILSHQSLQAYFKTTIGLVSILTLLSFQIQSFFLGAFLYTVPWPPGVAQIYWNTQKKRLLYVYC